VRRIWPGDDVGSHPPNKDAFSILLIAAAGALLAGIFPMDFPGRPHTSSGRLHALGGAFTFPKVLGVFLFSLSSRRDRYWRSVSRFLLALSAGIAVFALGIASFLFLGFAGYAQRLLVTLLYAWMILVGLDLIWFQREKPPI
jgi:hypothetical protein